MFDLFRRRDKAVRYLLGVLLGLVALSLVVTLIPGFGASGAPREQLVAQIGEEPLTVREVQTTLQSALKGKQIPQEMVQFYVPQLIDQMITERAVAFQAARMGFKITDVELANAIRSMLTQYFPTGDIDQQAYQRFLSSQGLNVTEFEKNVRQNLLLLRLQNIALEGAIVTPSEVESEYRRKNDKIKIEYVKFTPASDLKSKVAVTPEEVKTYYSTQKAQYNTPEKRSFHLLFANEQRIGANFEVPEQELRAAYNSSLDKYRSLERVRARHILIKADDKNKDDLAKAEAKASNLLKQIRGGADFAKLAKENSEDTGSGAKGGEMDWFARGQMVAPFENSAFSMKPNEISNLVKTQFGYHIIQVLEKESAKTKQFDEVKNEIATERKRESVFNRMQQAMDQARAELVKAPQNAQQIAAKHNLGYHKVENQKKGDPLPELGNSAEVDNAVTGLRPNEVSPVFQLGPNALAVTEMIQVSAPRPAELAEVENEIRDKILSQKAQQLADKQMKDATDKLKAGAAGGDVNVLAKQVGGEVKTSDFFASEGAAEGIGSASYLADGFTKGVGAMVGPFTVGNQVFLAKVIEKQPADPAKLAADRESLVLSLKKKRAAERKELFEDGLMTQLIKEGKVKKNPETITRIVQGYRG